MDELIKFPTSIIAKEKGFKLFNDNELGYASNQLVYDPDGTLCILLFDADPYHNKKWFELRKVNSSDRNDPKNKRIFPIKSNFEPAGIGTYLVPTQTALNKWLREVHHIDVDIESDRVLNTEIGKGYTCTVLSPTGTIFHWDLGGTHIRYEDALEIGLLEALKLIPVSIGKNYKFMVDADEYAGKVIDIQGKTASLAVFNGIIHNVPITELS